MGDNLDASSDPLDFRMLERLPPELLHQVLFNFCDGKSLSTFSLACSASSDETCQRIAARQVPLICRERLEVVASTIEDALGDGDYVIRGAIGWIRFIVSDLNEEQDADGNAAATLNRMRLLSENAAVLDYLQLSLDEYSNLEKGHFEWLVWCGRLTIESFSSEISCPPRRMLNTARVLISSPMQRPTSLIPGCGQLKSRHLSTVANPFRCEPYNIVPIPPWGKIHGLFPQDTRVLQPVADILQETNQVGVPTTGTSDASNAGANALDIRIVAPKQAASLSSRYPVRTAWMLQQQVENGAPLLACWQDETNELENDRDYVDYVIDLMRVRATLPTLPEPSVKPYGLVS